ncbi:hypothetical protein MUU53_13525 [Rhizobium lemnae]|uniref:Uncharacterized protein n=1 Tax=Rhizobium lemnae TaxID=1214924 RepID=A0ABV8EG71_9HYPH|nr:hypothetical protein [Rhizobium lemnae]MCJ8508931.1 hypothetical protein [Rhizobium lemnae]
MAAPSALRSWRLKLAKRLGSKRARVAGRPQAGGPVASASEMGLHFHGKKHVVF